MRTIILLLLFTHTLFGFSKNELLKLAAKDHNRNGLSKELLFFPEGRKFKVHMKLVYPERDIDPIIFISKDKVVGGKYLVSQSKLPDENNLTMIISYNKKLKAYKKWIVASNEDTVKEYLGVRLNNSISWYQIDKNQPDGTLSAGIDTYHKDKVEWVESYYKDGVLQYSFSGVANEIDEE